MGIIAYLSADLLILSIRPSFLSASQPRILQGPKQKKRDLLSQYRPISDFNVFHNDPIPPSLSSLQEEPKTPTGTPQPSRLPLTLKGTIVYQNELYSIAHITTTTKGKSDSYQIGDVIDTLARITHIESEKVYFINLNSNTEEYIKISSLSEQTGLKFRKPRRQVLPHRIKSKKPFNFQIQRSIVNKYFRNLPDILQKARVVPYWENGVLVGHQFKYIEPGSVYEKELGFKVSDIILSVNGEKVRSPIHAAELFHRVKSNSKLDMLVKRDGKDIPFSWSINEDSSIEEPSQLQ